MNKEIYFDGTKYISASDAAMVFGFTRDYVALLCRLGKVKGRRIGRNWYVEEAALQSFVIEKGHEREKRRAQLTAERAREYHITTGQQPLLKGTVPKKRAERSKSLHVAQGITAPVPSVSHHVHRIGNRVARAMGTHGTLALQQAARTASASVGASETALHSLVSIPAQVPFHAITPLGDFMQRLIAFSIAIGLTFGTYMLVDKDTARFARASVRDTGRSIAGWFGSVGITKIAADTESQLAAAAENPAGTFTGIVRTVLRSAVFLADKLYAGIDPLIHAVNSSRIGLLPPSTESNQAVGSVTVAVTPYAGTELPVASSTGAVPMGNVSAEVFRASEGICIGNTCITELEFQELLTLRGESDLDREGVAE